MAQLARRRFQPSDRWLFVLPPTALITGRPKTCRRLSLPDPRRSPAKTGQEARPT